MLRSLSILSTGYASRDSLTTPHIVVYTVICASIGRSIRFEGGRKRYLSFAKLRAVDLTCLSGQTYRSKFFRDFW